MDQEKYNTEAEAQKGANASVNVGGSIDLGKMVNKHKNRGKCAVCKYMLPRKKHTGCLVGGLHDFGDHCNIFKGIKIEENDEKI